MIEDFASLLTNEMVNTIWNKTMRQIPETDQSVMETLLLSVDKTTGGKLEKPAVKRMALSIVWRMK